ncbi:hypothetical protein [Pseudomonas tohonis]|uniref:hypothetical protein n=1 Tax=Pseudomonas tohonis TaxID=2725477 RepID=UPI001F24CC2A|nr:hypothetical protein [Pseudomonas tohonis]
MTFQRENRYIVIKRKDLIAAAETGAVDASFAEALDIVQDSLPTRECLVIESDWPEYEPSWQMIQARMEGATPPAAQVQEYFPRELLVRSVMNADEVDPKEIAARMCAAQVQGEREAFEAWVNPAWSLEKHTDFEGDTVYVEDWVQGAWIGWQARAALSAPPAAGVPEGLRDLLEMLVEPDARKVRYASDWRRDVHNRAAALLQALAAAPTPPASEQQQAWPKDWDVGRFGDMSQSAHLRVGLDADNDVYVSVYDEDGGASVEFCVPGSGGGRSGETRKALIALMVAMAKDNESAPDRDWWTNRGGPASTSQGDDPHLAGVNQGVTTEAGNGGDA